MQTSRLTRPVTAIRPRPAAPQPRWDRVFLEPAYADGQPYDSTASQTEDREDDEQAPTFITA